jgi:hypothetical protein
MASLRPWPASGCSSRWLPLQGVLLNTLPGRLFLRWSGYAQGVLISVLLLTALYSGSIGDWDPKTIARLPQFGAWLPPVWFAGLHEYLLGDRDPFLTAMAPAP